RSVDTLVSDEPELGRGIVVKDGDVYFTGGLDVLRVSGTTGRLERLAPRGDSVLESLVVTDGFIYWSTGTLGIVRLSVSKSETQPEQLAKVGNAGFAVDGRTLWWIGGMHLTKQSVVGHPINVCDAYGTLVVICDAYVFWYDVPTSAIRRVSRGG